MTLLPAGQIPIVDASVAIKWYLPEIHSAEARLLVRDAQAIYGLSTNAHPRSFFPECGNILWKRQRRGDLPAEKATAVMEALLALPFVVHTHSPLMEAAMKIAENTDRSVYDSVYVALAVQEQTKLITADQKLYNALHNSPLAWYLLWIANIKDIL